jgi:tetratricopeptide (TPR) repeat protein
LHEELGTEYRQAGKLDQAQAAFEREVQIDPHNPLAPYKLGALKVERGDGAGGKALIEAALQQNPHLKNAAYYLGRAELLMGNDAAAVAALKRALEADSDPEVVEQAWYQLGIVYRRMDRSEDAEKALATFQKLKREEAERQQGRAEKARETTGGDTQANPHAPDHP